MTDRTLAWKLPPVSNRQAEIDFTRIEFRVDESYPWTKQDDVPADGLQELVLVDVNAGPFFYQAVVYDVTGQVGEPAYASVDVPFDPPGSVTDFTITDTP